ncbi:N-acetylglucosaminyl-phosphatidylinositol de-N-acetylase-like isoform X2 [Varroa jacobsoni]|uniref:N-acetylglucosaminyl-phosphatidylinositol de-N-acetylase-like isoform X2 n=1 Tax=Varroa jacobsoni TaxID=62625 RepID=UPI000BF352CE|nr:N-acetylglucosaminyl-phosphatidylinositol de-N-acetylase-like isoform X2 [Varroa jacobsoni]
MFLMEPTLELWLTVAAITSIFFGLFIALAVIICSRKRRTAKQLGGVERLLLVTAHPDDESMFFGPLIVNEIERGTDVYLLCLSTGDYYREGSRRKAELLNACRSLGIPAGNITVIQHGLLPDNPKKRWNDRLVANLIYKYVTSLNCDTVVSFDHYGVTGHSNHVSIFDALLYFFEDPAETGLKIDFRVFMLESVNILRKYSGLLDGAFGYLWPSTYVYLLTPDQRRKLDLMVFTRFIPIHFSMLRCASWR